jgi:uncharacterized cupin superfamily protein
MVRPIRRIVAGNNDQGIAVALSDGPSPDVQLDPARPGFGMTRLWVTDSTPARTRGVRETLNLPHTLEPPPGGSIFRYLEVPPEIDGLSSISQGDVANYFQSVGSPSASTYTTGVPHPYMQKIDALDFCYILEGDVTLVLDKEEVNLREGDTVIQKGTNHAWSNRSDKPCIIVMSSHDARPD